MTAEIPLTRDLVALIDDTDAELISCYKWSAKPGKKTCYAVRRVLVAEGGGRRLQLMHKLLTGYVRTDHINGNGLDNRRANLRAATDLDNLRNMRKHRGSSRFKGVAWHNTKLRWRGRIRLSIGHQLHLGYFADETAAALAYDAAARAAFGEFAALNFPMPGERGALR